VLPVDADTAVHYAAVRETLREQGGRSLERCLDRCARPAAPLSGLDAGRALRPRRRRGAPGLVVRSFRRNQSARGTTGRSRLAELRAWTGRGAKVTLSCTCRPATASIHAREASLPGGPSPPAFSGRGRRARRSTPHEDPDAAVPDLGARTAGPRQRGFGSVRLLECAQPRIRLAPDVFVGLGIRDEEFSCWKTWERKTPDLAVEVVSPSDTPEGPWQEKLDRYHELGVKELVRFDADAPPGKRLRIWTGWTRTCSSAWSRGIGVRRK